jgi:hypothetical protein
MRILSGTEAAVYSDLFGGHYSVKNMWVYTPKGLRLMVEYSLTCLEVTTPEGYDLE